MPDGLLIHIGADVQQGLAGVRAVNASLTQLNQSTLNLVRSLKNDLDPNISGAFKKGVVSVSGMKGALETLRENMRLATNPAQIIQYNRAIKDLELNIKRVGVAGIATGGALSTGLTKGFSALRTVANILPGIGIGGLVGFAIDPLIAAFKKITTESNKAADAQKNFTTAIAGSGKDYKDAVTVVTELATNIELAKQGFISKDKVVNQFNETLGKTVGHVKNLDEAEASLIKNAEAYINMTLFKAAANVALTEASKKAFDIAQQLNKPVTTKDLITGGDTEQRAAQALAEKNTEVLALTKRANDAFFAGDKKLADDLFKKRNDLQNKLVEGGRFKGLRKEQESFLEIFRNFQAQAAAIAKEFKFDFTEGKFDSATKAVKELEKVSLISVKAVSNLNSVVSGIDFTNLAAFKIPVSTEIIPKINVGATQTNLQTALDFFSLKANTLKINVEVPKIPLGIVKEIGEQAQKTAALVSNTLTPAFSGLFDAILAGEDPLKAFFNSLMQSVQQLISQLIAAAVKALVLKIITKGTSGIVGAATGVGGQANWGNIGGGLAIDVRLQGGVRVQGNDLLIAWNRTVASQGRAG